MHYWTSTATCVSDFDGAIKRKRRSLQDCCCKGNIYLWLRTWWSWQIERNNYISSFIIISNIFEYQHNFISLCVLKNKNMWIKLEKIFLRGRGWWCLIMVMSTDVCWVGNFCVELGTFVSNECYSLNQNLMNKRKSLCRLVCLVHPAVWDKHRVSWDRLIPH